jgi:hypothetical protein
MRKKVLIWPFPSYYPKPLSKCKNWQKNLFFCGNLRFFENISIPYLSTKYQNNKKKCFPDGLKSWYDIPFTSILLKMWFYPISRWYYNLFFCNECKWFHLIPKVFIIPSAWKRVYILRKCKIPSSLSIWAYHRIHHDQPRSENPISHSKIQNRITQWLKLVIITFFDDVNGVVVSNADC